MSHWGPKCNNCIYKDDNCHACTYMPIDVLKDEENDNLKMNEELISKNKVLEKLKELNAISFYEANEDSKETYYEIRDAIKNFECEKIKDN